MFPPGNKVKVKKIFGFSVTAAFSEYKKPCSINDSIINIFFASTVWKKTLMNLKKKLCWLIYL